MYSLSLFKLKESMITVGYLRARKVVSEWSGEVRRAIEVRVRCLLTLETAASVVTAEPCNSSDWLSPTSVSQWNSLEHPNSKKSPGIEEGGWLYKLLIVSTIERDD